MPEELFPDPAADLARADFDTLGLRVGDRLAFQLRPTRLHPRLFTHLIGYERPQDRRLAAVGPPRGHKKTRGGPSFS